MTNSSLNLGTWRRIFARFNLVVDRVVGKFLDRFGGFGLGHKVKGFCLGRFMPKLSFKETLEISEFKGPGSDLDAGLVSTKCLTVSLRLETTSVAVSWVVLGLSEVRQNESSQVRYAFSGRSDSAAPRFVFPPLPTSSLDPLIAADGFFATAKGMLSSASLEGSLRSEGPSSGTVSNGVGSVELRYQPQGKV